MMGGPTRLYSNETEAEFLEERKKLRSSKALLDYDLPGRTNPMNLKNVLRDIDPDRGNPHNPFPPGSVQSLQACTA
jgi:hypothetical protein